MKLKLSAIQKLHKGLQALDGYAKHGEGGIIIEPYDFTGAFRWNIRKNLRILGGLVEDIEKVRKDLLVQRSGRKTGFDDKDESAANRQAIAEFHLEWAEQLKREDEVKGLLKIKQADLNLEKNKIAGTVLDALDPLLED